MNAMAARAVLPEILPALAPDLALPELTGTAALATAAMRGMALPNLLAEVQQRDTDPAARLLDLAILCQLFFRREEGLRLQAAALDAAPLYRIRSEGFRKAPLRLLALMAPGDLMANTPLDFITAHLDVELTLLFLRPGQPLPAVLPDHDLLFFAIGTGTAETTERLSRLFRAWPRPVLNDPAFLPGLERTELARRLQGLPGICSPEAVLADRALLRRIATGEAATDALWPGAAWPLLVRPEGSHAGAGLARIEGPAALGAHLETLDADLCTVTRFVDYAGADGLHRKFRIAFIEGRPFLCHMAASEHWMVHYLNAGMAESAAKRAEEAAAMDGFAEGFARRHAEAFRRLAAVLGFDYVSIDCAELPDGRLLVFEADTAAIVHLMEDPATFPYKQQHMRRVFEAFEAMLLRRAGRISKTNP